MSLTDEQKQLEQELQLEFFTFRTSLQSESDRGCALYAAAYLDHALGILLRRSMVQGKKLNDDLFSSQSPLSTFSSRIKIAYYLGKIDAETRRDLDIIRSIRNDFAHHPESVNFETQSIKDRCDNLKHIYNLEGRARSKYTGAVCALLAKIHGGTIFAVAIEEKAFKTDIAKIRSEVQEHLQTIETITNSLLSQTKLDSDSS